MINDDWEFYGEECSSCLAEQEREREEQEREKEDYD